MTPLVTLVVLAMLATIGALGMGVTSMVRGGAYDREHDVQLMFTRVILQGVTLLLLIASVLVAAN